jgi:hypothetical protein
MSTILKASEVTQEGHYWTRLDSRDEWSMCLIVSREDGLGEYRPAVEDEFALTGQYIGPPLTTKVTSRSSLREGRKQVALK